jgi:hypothetical protein
VDRRERLEGRPLTLSEGSPVGGASLFDGAASHFATRGSAVIGKMVRSFTIRTNRFLGALKGFEGGKGRRVEDGDVSGEIGWLASTAELDLVQDALGDHIKVNIGVMRQVLDGLSMTGEGAEAVGYGMKEDGGEDVIVFDLAHGGNTTEVASHLCKGVAEGCVINNSNFKELHKQADLGVGALVFM